MKIWYNDTLFNSTDVPMMLCFTNLERSYLGNHAIVEMQLRSTDQVILPLHAIYVTPKCKVKLGDTTLDPYKHRLLLGLDLEEAGTISVLEQLEGAKPLYRYIAHPPHMSQAALDGWCGEEP